MVFIINFLLFFATPPPPDETFHVFHGASSLPVSPRVLHRACRDVPKPE